MFNSSFIITAIVGIVRLPIVLLFAVFRMACASMIEVLKGFDKNSGPYNICGASAILFHIRLLKDSTAFERTKSVPPCSIFTHI